MTDTSTILEDTGSVNTEIGYTTFFARKRGRSHVAENRVCQDYCLVKEIEKKILVLAVADGHGGEDYVRSDRGSKIACDVLFSSIQNLYLSSSENSKDNWLNDIKKLEFKESYLQSWEAAVLADYEDDSEEKEETRHNIIRKYGTTILFAVITESQVAFGQLGDGAILLFNDGMQGQLFKRHSIKMSSQTSSLASSRAKYSFVTGVYERRMFSHFLLSTDGIYDKLDKPGAFLTYANGLLSQFKQNGNIENIFEVQDTDVSQIATDDCTVILAISDGKSEKYEVPFDETKYTGVTFIRAFNKIEVYHATEKDQKVELHIVEKGPVPKKSIDLKNCDILKCLRSEKLSDNKRMYVYNVPEDWRSLHEMIEHGEQREKRYWFNEPVLDLDDEDEPYESNQDRNTLCLNLYENLHLAEEELSQKKIGLRFDCLNTARISNDNKLAVYDYTLSSGRSRDNNLQTSFQNIYGYFSIIGKLTCGNTTIPLFSCKSHGQNIAQFHLSDTDKSLCRVVYNDKEKIYGLWNLSDHPWIIDDETKKEISPNSVLRMNRDQAILVYCPTSETVGDAEVVDDYVRYQLEIL